eukprot:GHVT01025185.1.p1 GENE.GHVT01025185.1~~GHVT01025185.1.p1  ORF type:complete len:219 (-),score=9.58 GHVT01025185.1:370-1026(-)
MQIPAMARGRQGCALGERSLERRATENYVLPPLPPDGSGRGLLDHLQGALVENRQSRRMAGTAPDNGGAVPASTNKGVETRGGSASRSPRSACLGNKDTRIVAQSDAGAHRLPSSTTMYANNSFANLRESIRQLLATVTITNLNYVRGVHHPADYWSRPTSSFCRQPVRQQYSWAIQLWIDCLARWPNTCRAIPPNGVAQTSRNSLISHPIKAGVPYH